MMLPHYKHGFKYDQNFILQTNFPPCCAVEEVHQTNQLLKDDQGRLILDCQIVPGLLSFTQGSTEEVLYYGLTSFLPIVHALATNSI